MSKNELEQSLMANFRDHTNQLSRLSSAHHGNEGVITFSFPGAVSESYNLSTEHDVPSHIPPDQGEYMVEGRLQQSTTFILSNSFRLKIKEHAHRHKKDEK